MSQPKEENPVIGKCPKCGLDIRQMMLYACPSSDCPVFTQVSF